jgi:uncharacterized small protein (DUF1192 family)
MKKDKEVVRIDLTPEQKEARRQQTGKEAAALELSVEELEERIAPSAALGSVRRL